MPRMEPKQVQKELEQGKLWPVYWLYGQERMKSRELLKRIRRAALGDEKPGGLGLGFGEETLDGTEVTSAEVVDSAQSLSLGGGVRFLVVREAHALKDWEALEALLGDSGKVDTLPFVCVFLSKDLDGRKKFSKVLADRAAVVACEEVPEEDRESWIHYLAKRRGFELEPEVVAQLRSLDPWSLDVIENELEKFDLAGRGEAGAAVLLGGVGSGEGTEAFLEAFFSRKKRAALDALASFVDSPDQTLPLLGLLAWNARFLALSVADRDRRTRFAKLSPFLAERFGRWMRAWSLEETVALQEALAEVDFETKQTGRLALGTWATLVQRFARD